MIFKNISPIAAGASAYIPLLYDTIVLGLTIYWFVYLDAKRHSTYVVKRLLEDGLAYYVVILAITSTLTIMIATAPDGELLTMW